MKAVRQPQPKQSAPNAITMPNCSSCSCCTVHRPQSSSASRFTAGAAGLLILSQCCERPERYSEPRSFDRKHSQPSNPFELTSGFSTAAKHIELVVWA